MTEATDKLPCWIYKSLRKQEMYLYLAKEDGFDDLPEALTSRFGRPEFVMELELHADRPLAREDALDSIRRDEARLGCAFSAAEREALVACTGGHPGLLKNGSELLSSGAPDTDGDGVVDPYDNCPHHPNADQADGDGNGVGDACETPTLIEAVSRKNHAAAGDLDIDLPYPGLDANGELLSDPRTGG